MPALPPWQPLRPHYDEVQHLYGLFHSAVRSLDSASINIDGQVNSAFDSAILHDFRCIRLVFWHVDSLVSQVVLNTTMIYAPRDSLCRLVQARWTHVMSPSMAADTADFIMFKLRDRVPALERRLVAYHE